MKFGVHIPYNVPYGGFLYRADIPNSFGNRAFLNTRKAVYTTMAKHKLLYGSWLIRPPFELGPQIGQFGPGQFGPC